MSEWSAKKRVRPTIAMTKALRKQIRELRKSHDMETLDLQRENWRAREIIRGQPYFYEIENRRIQQELKLLRASRPRPIPIIVDGFVWSILSAAAKEVTHGN